MIGLVLVSLMREEIMLLLNLYTKIILLRHIRNLNMQEEIVRGDNKYTQLINNLEENGIGVKKLTRERKSIGLQLTQVIHPNLKLLNKLSLSQQEMLE